VTSVGSTPAWVQNGDTDADTQENHSTPKMFFTRKSSPSTARSTRDAAPAASPSDGNATVVLDALGTMLQLYGRHALDTAHLDADVARAKITDWMRHVTLGAPHPVHGGEQARGLTNRDWRGLVQFFGEHRRGEQQAAQTGMRELRDTVWAVVTSTHRIAETDVACGNAIADQLERVKTALHGTDPAAVRREALAAVQVVGTLMTQQREAHRREQAALAQRLRALGSQLEEARRETTLDPLTRLANRKGWDEAIERSIALHSLSGEPASLLMIDMDHFKAANDTYGHQVGDAALRAVGDCLARVFLRRCDLVCRYGGDEFAVLLAETGVDKAAILGERVLGAVRDVQFPERSQLDLDLSVGVAAFVNGDCAASWVERADAALYVAKQNGGGQVIVAA
jgi:diguanylate cyclase